MLKTAFLKLTEQNYVSSIKTRMGKKEERRRDKSRFENGDEDVALKRNGSLPDNNIRTYHDNPINQDKDDKTKIWIRIH